MLRFRMLGAFEAHRGDERIPTTAWRTRHARTVLEILLDQRGRSVPFDRLADLVWPEADPAAARSSLQVAVGIIRRVLEPELRSGTASRQVRTEGSAYRFVADGCQVDADEFARERERALAAERAGDRERAAAHCRGALALYRGEYLADDADAEWLLAGRELVREQVLDLVERLARTLVALGRPDEAIAAAERGLAVDPLREELYQALMGSHLAAGRRSHALAAYERCRRALRAQLGAEPSAATRRLLEAKAGPAAAGARAGVAPAASRPHGDVPFVGRTLELAALRGAWERAVREAGVVAYVHGPAGVGKTRLARELSDALDPRVRTSWMAGHEPEQSLSFAPIVTLLAGWLDRGATVGQLQRFGPYAPVLAHHLPKVREVWPDCPPLAASPPDPTALLEAFVRAVVVASSGPRSLLVIDDAQWADEATVVWLGYLSRRLPAGTLLLVTRRSGEPSSRALDAQIAEWRTAGRLADVALGPLSRAEIEHVVAVVSEGAPSSAAIGARIHEATEGYPLFAVEILRELRQRGELSGATAGELPIPATVREAIALRVGRLEAAPRDALEVLAVFGVPASTGLLGPIAGQDPATLLASLERLLERELVRPTADGQRYALEHPVVGRTIYDALPAPRRAAWHRRAATVLRERAADDPSAGGQVLRHLAASGAGGEELAAAAERVGEQALRRHLYADAIAAFGLARDRVAGSPDPDAGPRGMRVVERLGEALHGAARWDEALACYRELLEATDGALPRSALRRKIAQVLGDVGGRFTEALTMLDEAERDLGSDVADEVRIERGRIEAARTVALFYRGEYHEAVERGERALALWDGCDGVERDAMEQLSRIASSEQRLGRLDGAEPRLRRALAAARRVGDRLAEARYLDNLASVLLQRGSVRAALDMKEDARRLYAETGVPKYEMIGLVNLANTLTILGDLPAARRAYEDAIERSETLRARYTTMHSLVGLGETLVRLGETGAARRALERGIAIAEDIGNRQRLAHAHVYLGELALVEGRPGDARTEAERGLAIGAPIDDSHTAREGCRVLARAHLALGDASAAEVAAWRGLERATAGGFGVSVARNRVALAEALWQAGDAHGTKRELDQAITTFRAAPARYDLALALLVQATTVLSTRRRGASAALAEALALARECAARPLVERIAATTAALAVRTTRAVGATSGERPG